MLSRIKLKASRLPKLLPGSLPCSSSFYICLSCHLVSTWLSVFPWLPGTVYITLAEVALVYTSIHGKRQLLITRSMKLWELYLKQAKTWSWSWSSARRADWQLYGCTYWTRGAIRCDAKVSNERERILGILCSVFFRQRRSRGSGSQTAIHSFIVLVLPACAHMPKFSAYPAFKWLPCRLSRLDNYKVGLFYYSWTKWPLRIGDHQRCNKFKKVITLDVHHIWF